MDNTVELQDALSMFGKMLNIALIYGMEHPSVRAPLIETHLAFESALRDAPQITIGLFNNALTVNDKMISEYTIHLRALERRLISLNIPHLVVRQGLSSDELGLLVGALCTSNSRDGHTLKDKLEEAGLSNIKTEEVEYVAQHEGESLVGGGTEDGTGEGGDEGEGSKAAPTVHVEQIVAFLKGENGAADTPSADLQEMLSDPEKLARLIMESVAIRQTAQSLDGGESLADMVIGCLRRTYGDLNQQKKYKSARGKAGLNKAMLLLEKTVMDKIRNAVGEANPEVDDRILTALHEMEEDRQVKILAARYAEQTKKMAKAEAELIQYSQEHRGEKFQGVLKDAGVSEEEWKRLSVQDRAGSEGAGGNIGSEGKNAASGRGLAGALNMGALAIVLDKLENIMQFDETAPEVMSAVVSDARSGIADIKAQFDGQIEALKGQIKLHEDESERADSDQMSRADLLLQISLFSLKLAQPLSVINASVEAATQQISNPVLQKEFLDLAQESGKVMKDLMERLTELAGYPSMQDADMGLSG